MSARICRIWDSRILKCCRILTFLNSLFFLAKIHAWEFHVTWIPRIPVLFRNYLNFLVEFYMVCRSHCMDSQIGHDPVWVFEILRRKQKIIHLSSWTNFSLRSWFNRTTYLKMRSNRSKNCYLVSRSFLMRLTHKCQHEGVYQSLIWNTPFAWRKGIFKAKEKRMWWMRFLASIRSGFISTPRLKSSQKSLILFGSPLQSTVSLLLFSFRNPDISFLIGVRDYLIRNRIDSENLDVFGNCIASSWFSNNH